MTCPHCGGKGIFRVKYHSGELDHFAVCVCEAARFYRSDENASRHTGSYGWQVWAAANHADPDRVRFVEDLLEPEEMAAAFPEWQADTGTAAVETSAIAAAMRTRKGKL